jgi:hypothetical protein
MVKFPRFHSNFRTHRGYHFFQTGTNQRTDTEQIVIQIDNIYFE